MIDAYKTLLAKSEELGLPEIYKTDLTVHDKKRLETENFTKFIWIVRQCGTELLSLPIAPEDRQAALGWTRVTVQNHPEAKGFLYSNGELKPIDLKKTFLKV